MQILRLPPYPLSVTYTVPDANSYYVLVINDTSEQNIQEFSVVSDSNNKITYSLDGDFVKYDKSYALTIYEDLSESSAELIRGDIVVEDNLDIVRPYVNPATLGTTATEIAEYTLHENLARAIIDSVTGGFYYNRSYLETVGQGTDYISLWKKTDKILKAYENTVLVYDTSLAEPATGDYTYIITKDKTAITKDLVNQFDEINRAERKPARMPLAMSDSYNIFDTEDSGHTQTVSGGVAFAEGTDYIFLLETGYRVVPYDIQDATLMLIDDIKCGKLDYYKRYVKNYKTDQFEIEYDKRLIDGTGNILVDKILAKYVTKISSPGIL
jgi:hypothetical protein